MHAKAQIILKKLFQWVKPLITAFIVIALLQVTGLMSSVSSFTQSALLKTGIRNASTKPLKNPESFDYNFTLRTLNGQRIKFEDFKGKVVFLNLWATWCGPCRSEMPTIQSLYEKVGSDDVVFVILSVDYDKDEPKITPYITRNKYTFPVYRPSGSLTSQLDVPGIPTTLIIDKEGKIVRKEVGATNFDTEKFRKFILSLR
ncbi:MAG TPA: TlpA disulfide reductase family protein [Cyclobacteriaceae bacterium]|nr:TlpA disulfide reductase family protein [Cyclobacteriaceae bacterium]